MRKPCHWISLYPLKNDDQSTESVLTQTNLPKEQIIDLTPVLKDLSSKLEMSTLGYLRLLRLHRIDEPDKFDPENVSYQWVPLSLEFGIPILSPKLCQKICERVVASHASER